MKIKELLSTRGFVLPVIALCSLFLGALPSEAAPVPVTLSFTGSVSGVTGPQLPSLIATGLHNMSGNITYDSSALPVFPGTGFFPNSITGLTLNLNLMSGGTYTASYASGSNGIFIVNSPPAVGADSITAFSSATSTSFIGGTLPASFFVSLSDPDGNVIGHLALPATPPSVGLFANNEWRLAFANGNEVVGSFSNLQAVPLPPAVTLFGAALVALVGLGAGNWKQRKSPPA